MLAHLRCCVSAAARRQRGGGWTVQQPRRALLRVPGPSRCHPNNGTRHVSVTGSVPHFRNGAWIRPTFLRVLQTRFAAVNCLHCRVQTPETAPRPATVKEVGRTQHTATAPPPRDCCGAASAADAWQLGNKLGSDAAAVATRAGTHRRALDVLLQLPVHTPVPGCRAPWRRSTSLTLRPARARSHGSCLQPPKTSAFSTSQVRALCACAACMYRAIS